jgi:Ser/Thr protein kinase RdoA (MazF antagonist)
VTGLIDCSACRSDHVAIDLARLLGSLVGDDESAWQVALGAYARRRPFRVDEINLVRVFDESGVLLSPLTWFERRFIQRERFAKPRRVIERVEGFLVRLQTLADSL